MDKRFRRLLSLALAALAIVCALAYGEQVRGEAEAARNEALERFGGEATTVVVVSEAVEPGSRLGAHCCREVTWPSDLVPEDARRSLADVEGEELTSPLSAGSPVTGAALRRAQDLLEVPSGQVALTVPVGDRTGVTADVGQGSLLAAYRVQDAGVRLLSSQVTVLGAPATSGTGASLTLAVPVEDVAAMVTASADGSLRLVRPAGDVEDLEGLVAAGDVEPA